MNKRPKEIEESMDYIEGICPDYITKTIYDYIKSLEDTIQHMLNEEEKFYDDCK